MSMEETDFSRGRVSYGNSAIKLLKDFFLLSWHSDVIDERAASCCSLRVVFEVFSSRVFCARYTVFLAS